MNPAFFGDPETIKKHLSTYMQALRESPKAEGQTRIYTHGEKEIAAILASDPLKCRDDYARVPALQSELDAAVERWAELGERA